jgi:hypothetical protein
MASWPGGANGAASASTPSPTWATYFYPTVIGYVCHEAFLTAAASGAETLTVNAVRRTSSGTDVTVLESGNTQVADKGVPSSATLHYILTKSGRLIEVGSNVLLAGAAASTNGDTVFPSVPSLLAGHSGTSTARTDYPLSAADQSQLQGVLEPHQTTLDASVVLRSTGAAISSLTLPYGTIGTLHHVLRIATSISSLTVTNVIKGARKEFDKEMRGVISKELNVTTYFAPHLGPIEVNLLNTRIYATSCTR